MDGLAGQDMDAQGPDSQAVRRAAAALRSGRLVAFPTETVYGLGADATDDRAVASIFEAKARPRFNPLIVHVADSTAGAAIAEWSGLADRLAARFWPGPLTLILRRRSRSGISELVSAGGGTIALRAPAHALARALLQAAERPIAAPSANRSGRISPTTADHVRQSLGDRVDMILDGGACPVGVESTVLDLTGARPALLRPGGLARADIETVIGGRLEGADETPPPRSRPALAGTAGEPLRAPSPPPAERRDMLPPTRPCSPSGRRRSQGRRSPPISARPAISARPPPICSPCCITSIVSPSPASRRCPSRRPASARRSATG